MNLTYEIISTADSSALESDLEGLEYSLELISSQVSEKTKMFFSFACDIRWSGQLYSLLTVSASPFCRDIQFLLSSYMLSLNPRALLWFDKL